MHTKLKLIGAALVALAITLLPALAFTIHSTHAHGIASLLAVLTLGVAGVTVTYAENLNAPRNAVGNFIGGNTAPTAAQAANLNSLVSTVVFIDTDTTATIIHNWGLNAAQLLAGQPWISSYWSVLGTVPVQVSFAVSNTNVIITKASAAGSNGTLVVILENPNSLIQ